MSPSTPRIKKGRRALTRELASAIYRARTQAKKTRTDVAREAGVPRQFVKFCEILWLKTVDETSLLAVLRVLEVNESQITFPPDALPPFRRSSRTGWRAPHVEEFVRKHRAFLPRLSKEDRIILRKLAEGQSEREVAVFFGISPATINTRKHAIERTLRFFADLPQLPAKKSISAALRECTSSEVSAIINLVESIARGRYVRLGPEHRSVLNALFLTECSPTTRSETRTKIFRMLREHSRYLRMIRWNATEEQPVKTTASDT